MVINILNMAFGAKSLCPVICVQFESLLHVYENIYMGYSPGTQSDLSFC